jgi:hypothetical protein
MEPIGLFRPFTTSTSSPYSYLPGWEYSSGETYINQYTDSGDSYQPKTSFLFNGDKVDSSRYGFYQHEQVPPIDGESHLPISVVTLSPFLSSGTSLGWDWRSENWGENGPHTLGTSEGHDIEYIARDGLYPANLSIRHPEDNYSTTHNYRGIALRGPLIIAGWGFDIDNKPVPNKSVSYPEKPEMEFEENWLRKPSHWKCGPVDLRWDYERKVWTAPSPMKMVRVKMLNYGYGLIFEDQVQYDASGEAIAQTEYPYDNPDEEDIRKFSGYPIEINSDFSLFPGDIVCAYFDTSLNKYYAIASNREPRIYRTGILRETKYQPYYQCELSNIYYRVEVINYTTETTYDIYVAVPFIESSWATAVESGGRAISSGTEIGIISNWSNGRTEIVSVAGYGERQWIDIITDVSFDYDTCELVKAYKRILVLGVEDVPTSSSSSYN